MKTSIPKPETPHWYVVDATGEHLGRLATQIAHVINGKHKVSFSPHQVMGDHVIVLNAEKIVLYGKKAEQKEYISHHGYFGHIKRIPFAKLLVKSPETILNTAICGMLPRNKLRDRKMELLHVFAGTDHPHAAQTPETFEKVFPQSSRS